MEVTGYCDVKSNDWSILSRTVLTGFSQTNDVYLLALHVEVQKISFNYKERQNLSIVVTYFRKCLEALPYYHEGIRIFTSRQFTLTEEKDVNFFGALNKLHLDLNAI